MPVIRDMQRRIETLERMIEDANSRLDEVSETCDSVSDRIDDTCAPEIPETGHAAWARTVMWGLIAMSFGLAVYAVNMAPVEKSPQLACIERRGTWIKGWGNGGTCHWTTTTTEAKP